MARLPRLYAPQVPQLAQVRFAHPLAAPADPAPADKLDLLAGWLRDAAKDHAVPVHGWVLLGDRLAVLATPPGPGSLSRLMQAVGRRFAARLQHGRVYAERYRSALVQPGRWVLPALVWLERLPVQYHYVDRAEQWPWSSATRHLGNNGPASRWGTEHVDYWHEGNTPFDRQARYGQRLGQGLAQADQRRIEEALFGQWALGDPDFLAGIRPLATRRLGPAARGRPRKAAPPPEAPPQAAPEVSPQAAADPAQE